MDLFTPVITDDRLHKHFKYIIDEDVPYARDVLVEWANGFIDRDGKFVREFQSTFNSSFWELYLFASIKEFKYQVDFSFAAPDFVITEKDDRVVCVEATTSNHAEDSVPEWEAEVENLNKIDRNLIVEHSSIRLANALISKSRKYKRSYKNLEQVKRKPFVLAIAPFEQPFFWAQNDQAIRQVLYGYKIPVYKDIPQENRREIYGHEYIDFIEKPNGAEVPMGYFSNGDMPEISAVIFSNTATFGKVRALSDDPRQMVFEHLRFNRDGIKPHHRTSLKSEYQETLLEGLHVYHNPTARYSLSSDFLDHSDITHHWFSLEDRMPYDDAKDEALFQRTVMNFGFS